MLPRNLFRKPHNQLEDLEGATTGHAPSVPQQLFSNCPSCRAMLAQDDLPASCYVCPQCGHHLRLGARKRLALICDPDSFQEMDAGLTGGNPLDFPDYADKLDKARKASGEVEGVITGIGRVDGISAALFAMEPAFMMGSMGAVVGEKITRLFEEATRQELPVVGFTVSGGARMQEGMISLMQMAKTAAALKRHSDAGLLYISVLADPTTGGVTASFAMLGDVILAEPKALIGFAGPRVIEQTIGQKLPKGFQRSEFLLEHGFIDLITPRSHQREVIAQLLRMHDAEKQGVCTEKAEEETEGEA